MVPIKPLLCLILGCVVVAEKFTAQQRTQFDGFLKRFRLKYAAKDYDARLGLYQRNLKRIEQFNKRSKGAKFVANKFAVMNDVELKRVRSTSEFFALHLTIALSLLYDFPVLRNKTLVSTASGCFQEVSPELQR